MSKSIFDYIDESGSAGAARGQPRPGGPVSFRDPEWDAAEIAASEKTGVPLDVLRSIRVNGERSNADQVSQAGARGVYQFMPATRDAFVKKYGVDAYSQDPAEQATAAALHLKESYGRTGDWGRAAAGYNGGISGERGTNRTRENAEYVERVMSGVGGIPRGEPRATQSGGSGPYYSAPRGLVFAEPGIGGQSPTVGDYAKKAGASFVRGVGMLGEAVGDAAALVANDVTGTQEYSGFNPLDERGLGIAKRIEDSMTPAGQAAAQDGFKGNLFDPDTWQAPETASGAIMAGVDAFGNIGSFFATSLATGGWSLLGKATQLSKAASSAAKAAKAAELAGDASKASLELARAAKLASQAKSAAKASSLHGAAVGGGMTYGDAANDAKAFAEQTIRSMSHDDLMEQVPIYRDAIDDGRDEQYARDLVVNRAGQFGGLLAAGPGALSGGLSSKLLVDIVGKKAAPALLGGALQSRAARGATEGLLVGSAEGLGEATEKMGSNAGGNIAVGRGFEDNIGRDTLAEAVGGFIGGKVTGGVAGLASEAPARAKSPVAEAAERPNSPLARAVLESNPHLRAAPADPVATRVAEIETAVRDGGMLQKLRDIGARNPGLAESVLSALATAKNPDAPASARATALGTLESALQALSEANIARVGSQWQNNAPADAGPGLAAQRAGQQWQDLGVESPVDALNAQANLAKAGSAWQGMQPGTAQGPVSNASRTSEITAADGSPLETGGAIQPPAPAPVQMPTELSFPDHSTPLAPPAKPSVAPAVAAEEPEKPRKVVTAPAVDLPSQKPGEPVLPAAVRQRKAQLAAMVDAGFDAIEQRDGKFWLVNHGDNYEMPLDNAADAARAGLAIKTKMDRDAHQSINSPLNDKSPASEAQIAADNYSKPPVKRFGLTFKTENPSGSTRSGTDASGKPWSATMNHHYTGIEGTKSTDGSLVDAFLGDGHKIFVVDQVDPKTGLHDEPKALVGFRNEEEARKAYLSNYAKDWKGLGAITEMSVPEFRKWVKSSAAALPVSPTIKSSQETKNDGRGNQAAQDAASRLADRDSGPGDQGLPANGGLRSEGESVLRNAKDSERGDSGAAQGVARDHVADRAAVARLRSDPKTARLTIEDVEDGDPALASVEPLISYFAAKFGRRAVPVRVTGEGAFDGVNVGRDFFINLDQPFMPLVESLVHEFSHTNEIGDQRVEPSGLAALHQRMFELIPKSAKEIYLSYLIDSGQVKPGRTLETLRPEDVILLRSEMTRDFMGRRFNDKEWLTKLGQEKPHLFGNFIRDWIKLLDDLIEAFRGKLNPFDRRGSDRKNIDHMMRGHLKELEEMKAIAMEVAEQWALSHQSMAQRLGVNQAIEQGRARMSAQDGDGKVYYRSGNERAGYMGMTFLAEDEGLAQKYEAGLMGVPGKRNGVSAHRLMSGKIADMTADPVARDIALKALRVNGEYGWLSADEPRFSRGYFTFFEQDRVVDALKAAGYDGMRVAEYPTGDGKTVAVFNPGIIAPAEQPDIRQSARRPSAAEQAELQAELDAEMGVDTQHRGIEIAEDVTDAAIRKAGIHAEDAFPAPRWKSNGEGGYTLSIKGLYGGERTVRLSIDSVGDGLYETSIEGAWLGPASSESSGYVSLAGAKDFIRRQIAARELRARGYDLATSLKPEQIDAIVEGWEVLNTMDDSARKYPLTDENAVSVQELAREMGLDEGYRVKATETLHDPDNKTLRIDFTDKATGETEGGNVNMTRIGGEWHVSASTIEFKKGGLGTAFYQLAVEHLARRNLQLSPESTLSGINTYRRTEQMLAAALRNGISNAMVPHPVQRIYGFKNNASTDVEHRANLARMLIANLRNVRELVPVFDKLRYHPETGAFTYKNGRDAGKALDDLIGHKGEKLIAIATDARSFGLGRSTIARALLTQEMLDGHFKAPKSFAEPVMYSARDQAEIEYAAVEAKYRGTEQWMKAPNGKPTNLTERQWIQVRTPSFVRWFGPWEKFAGTRAGVWNDDKGEVSKVVDENGEPSVVYHGTTNGGFMAFNRPRGDRRGDLGIFATDNYDMARSYVRKGRSTDIEAQDDKAILEEMGVEFRQDGAEAYWTDSYGQEQGPFKSMDDAVRDAWDEMRAELRDDAETPGIYALFMNLRNPNEENFEGALWNGSRDHQWVVEMAGEIQADANGTQYFDSKEDAADFAQTFVADDAEGDDADPLNYVRGADEHYLTSDDVVRDAIRSKQDGAIIREVIDDGGGPGPYNGMPADVFVALDSNQVKSAEWNTGEFGLSDDLRYSAKDVKDEMLQATPGLAKAANSLTKAEASKLRKDTAAKMMEIYKALPSVNEVMAVAYAGKANRGWYQHSVEAIQHIFGEDGWRFAALLAATSPQNSVEVNLQNALNIWKNWDAAGRPTDKRSIVKIMGQSVLGDKGEDSVLHSWIANTTVALSANSFAEVVLSGPKVDSFMRNLNGDLVEVANDAWIANYALIPQTMFSGSANKGRTDPGKGPGYLAMNAKVREAARRLGWQPAEVQETVWSWAMSMLEAMDRMGETRGALQLLDDGALTDDVIAATPDFRTLFHKDVYASILSDAGYGKALESLQPTPKAEPSSEGKPFSDSKMRDLLGDAGLRLEFLQRQRRTNVQVSWEARPGRNTGILPGIHAAPIELQRQYLADILTAITKAGFKKMTGFSLRNTLFGPGAWQSEVLPGAQTMSRPGVEADGKGGVMVDAKTRQKLSIVSSVLGLVLNQDGVYWHYPIYRSGNAEHDNGVEVNYGRSLTNDEMTALYRAIIKAAGHDQWAPANTPTGVRVLNFSDTPNKEFHRTIGKALKIADRQLELAASWKTFSSDGDAIENNWTENQDGQDYLSRISKAGRPDLLQWATGPLQAVVDAVAREYSERHGWGAPTRADLRLNARDATGDRPGDRSRPLDAATIRGAIHFGRQKGLSILSGASNGSGIRGAEDERVSQATDPRIKKRVYFYSPVQGGIPNPEAGLGGNVYQADIEGLYDPRTATAPVRGQGNAFESAVLDAGYSGYVDPVSGVMVVLNADVPVKNIGSIGDFKVVQRVAAQFKPKTATRAEGQELARKIEDGQFGEIFRAKREIQAVAPSFKTGNGEARVLASEAPAADLAMEQAGTSFRFGDVRYSAREIPGFYSELRKQVEASSMRQAPPEAWKTFIRALAQKGVKQDEIEWTGVNDFLDTKTGKVPKSDLLEYLDAGGVKVQEVVLGNDDKWVVRTAGDQETKFFDSEKEARMFVEDMVSNDIENERDSDWTDDDESDAYNRAEERYIVYEPGAWDMGVATYGKYTLPGGTNYREVLLTLPDRNTNRLLAIKKRWDARGDFASESDRDFFLANSHGAAPGESMLYRSPHWSEPNVLAHIRVNDRTDADGKRVLFVEEAQSDWSQDGRKNGFAGSEPERFKVVDQSGRMLRGDLTREQAEQIAKEDGLAVEADVGRQEMLSKVPAAPFVSARKFAVYKGGKELVTQNKGGKDVKHVYGDIEAAQAAATKHGGEVRDLGMEENTQGWLNLALKRVMLMAVEGGYDKIAFIDGQQSADRYKLSNELGSIEWRPNGRGADRIVKFEMKAGERADVFVGASGRIGRVDTRAPVLSGLNGKQLDEVIGKDLAARVMGEDRGRAEGEGLDIGGAGMKKFYDSIVPNAVKAMAKKLGGEVGEVAIVGIEKHASQGDIYGDPSIKEGSAKIEKIGGKYRVVVGDMLHGVPFKTAKEAQSYIDAMTVKARPQPGLTITPSMREKVGSGLPLFSARDTEAAEAAGFDTSKVWYHGTVARANFRALKAGKGGFDELGRGIYFTGKPEYAGSWAGRPGDGGRIIPAYIRKGDIYDLAKPLSNLALAKRIIERNPPTDIERQAKQIRDSKSVTEWTAEEMRIVNQADSNGLWRSWLLEPPAKLATHIKGADRNTWLSRAGYVGAVNANSQIPDQIVVFKPEDVRVPWAKFNPRHAGKADLLLSARDAEDTPAFKAWSEGLPVVGEGEYKGGPAVFVAYHATTHGNITEFKRQGSKEGFLGEGPYFTTSPDDASANYAGVGPDLTNRIEALAESYEPDDWRSKREYLDDYFAKYDTLTPGSWAERSDDEDYVESVWNGPDGFGNASLRHAATVELKGDSDGLVMKTYVKLKNPADTTGKQMLDYNVETNEDGDVVDETGLVVDWILAARDIGREYGIEREAERHIDDILSEAADGEVSMKAVFDSALHRLLDASDSDDYVSAGQVFSKIAEAVGFDGVIMDAGLHFGPNRHGVMGVGGMKGVRNDTLHIVPFTGNQVKSATGNNGDYSLEFNDIRKSARLDDYLAQRNKSMTTVTPRSVLEADIDLAVKALDAAVTEIKAGNYRQMAVPIGPAPHALRMLGSSVQMMKADASIVKKVLVEKHAGDFAETSTRDFVMGLYRPALILSGDQAGDYELVSSILTEDGPVMFALKRDVQSGAGEVKLTTVKSAYARPVAGGGNTIAKRILSGKLMYADMLTAPSAITGNKVKSQSLWTGFENSETPDDFSDALPQFRETPSKVDSGAILPKDGKYVKGIATPLGGINDRRAQFRETPPPSERPQNIQNQSAPVNPKYAGWRVVSSKILGGIADKKIKTDVDLVGWIAKHYKGDIKDVPSFSARDAAWTDDRLDRLMSKYAYTMDDNRTKAYAGWVRPDEFLAATTPASYRGRLEAEAGDLDKAELANQVQEIMLISRDHPAGGQFKTEGHEGRHRMVALRKAGVERVPVIFAIPTKNDAKPLDDVRVTAQKWSGGPNAEAGFTVDRLIPVSWAHQGELKAEFGQEAEVRFSAREGWEAPGPSRWDDFVYKAQDKHIDTKRVIEAVQKAGRQVADDINVYLQEELFHGRTAKRTKDFGEFELEPVLRKMADAGLTIGDVEEYLHARHAEEANRIIAERNPDVEGLQDGGSGMETATARKYLDGLSNEDRSKLEDVAADVDAIIARTRQLYADYGLESQAKVDGWATMFEHYVPLYREDKDGGMGIGQGISVKGKEVKGRTGSRRKVVDILANIAMQREKVITRGEKNRVAQALVGLAAANPNEEFWSVGPPAPGRVYDPATNTVVERMDPMYKSRPNTIVAKLKDADGSVREMAVVFNEDSDRAMRMSQALKNMDAGQLEGVLGVSAKITRYFAAINTQYNPVFGVVNLIRDVQGAMLNLGGTPLEGDRMRIARDTASALAGIYRDVRAARDGRQPDSEWAHLWDEFQEEGGQTGYRELFRTSKDRADELQKILSPDGWMDSRLGQIFTANGQLRVPMSQAKKGAGWLFDWLSDYNEAMENGVRLAAYKAAKDRGMSKQQAASLAKNLTVNFNRKGQIGLQAGAVYAFFNAAMQGSARIGKTLFDMDGGNLKTLRLSKTGKTIVYGGMVLGSMQALALAAAGFGEDDPPEFVRERSLIIPVGGKSYITIPMPLGLHVIPGLGRHATEFVLGGFQKPQKRVIDIVGMFADAFNPIGNAGMSIQTIAPTAIDPLVALTENKDWTGKPIARVSSNKALPGHSQWKDSATGLAKVIAEAINTATGGNQYVAGVISPTPDQIDYLIGQVTGGVGREASKLEQTVKGLARGEELPPNKVPLFGRFYGNAKSQASEGNAFYAASNRLNEIETEVKGLRKDGKHAEAAAVMRDQPGAYLVAKINVAERQIQRLKREKRELIERGAARESIRAKEMQITEAMGRFNRAYEAAMR